MTRVYSQRGEHFFVGSARAAHERPRHGVFDVKIADWQRIRVAV